MVDEHWPERQTGNFGIVEMGKNRISAPPGFPTALFALQYLHDHFHLFQVLIAFLWFTGVNLFSCAHFYVRYSSVLQLRKERGSQTLFYI